MKVILTSMVVTLLRERQSLETWEGFGNIYFLGAVLIGNIVRKQPVILLLLVGQAINIALVAMRRQRYARLLKRLPREAMWELMRELHRLATEEKEASVQKLLRKIRQDLATLYKNN